MSFDTTEEEQLTIECSNLLNDFFLSEFGFVKGGIKFK